MKRSLLSCLSQLFGYASLMGVFIAQAAKPLMGVLSASASLSASDLITAELHLIGLLLYFVMVIAIGEWIVKPLVVSPLTHRRIRLAQQLRTAGWENQQVESFLAIWICLSLAIGVTVNLWLELMILKPFHG